MAKDHDAVDVGLGEYVRTNSTAPWLATYRLLSKSSPCVPEVAIRMAQMSEFERSYAHVLLYPPQPISVVDYDGRQGSFSTKMYGSTFCSGNSGFNMSVFGFACSCGQHQRIVAYVFPL